KIKPEGAAANLVRPERRAAGADWDAALETVDLARLVADAGIELNAWSGPAWLREGWFHAERLLGNAIQDSEAKARVAAMAARLQAGDLAAPIERINLERDLVAALTEGCRNLVVGYTVRREAFNADFNDGIENVGFDTLSGLNSGMFV